MQQELSPIVFSAAIAALSLLVIALFLAFWRMARGPALTDRVVALDLIASIIIGMIAVYSIVSGIALYLNAAVVLALILFLGTVALARYLERGAQ